MTASEVRVYLKLLSLGGSTAHALAARLDENRTTTYSLLASLQKKGFVAYFEKAGVKNFVATDPSILVNHFIGEAHALKAILPQLLAFSNSAAHKPKITFYEGVSGVKQIAEILLEVPGSLRESFMCMDDNLMHPEVKRFYEEDFVPRRIELGIKYRGIVGSKMPMSTRHSPTDEAHLRELKHVDPQKFPIKIHVDIFPRNKVALYTYNKDEQMGVVIEHEDFFITMRTIFALAWNSL